MSGPALPEGNLDTSCPPDEVRVSRLLRATPQRVWSLVSSEEGMRRWLGLLLFQPRPGGRMLYDTNAAGPEDRIIIWGRVKEIDALRRIAFTWRVMTEDARAWPVDTLLSLDLEDSDQGCKVTLTHSGFAALGQMAAPMYSVYHHCWAQTPYLQLLDTQASGHVEDG